MVFDLTFVILIALAVYILLGAAWSVAAYYLAKRVLRGLRAVWVGLKETHEAAPDLPLHQGAGHLAK